MWSRMVRRDADRAPALLLVAHGSGDPAASVAHAGLVDRVHAAAPGLDVTLCHVDHTEPSLAESTGLLAVHVGVVALKKDSQRQRLAAPATNISLLAGCFSKLRKKSILFGSSPKPALLKFIPPSVVRAIEVPAYS